MGVCPPWSEVQPGVVGMKRNSEQLRVLRQLLPWLVRRYGRPKPPAVGEPINEIMYAVLCRWAPESRAGAAVQHLRRVTVDLNDLRVTPVIELADLLGKSFPRARESAEALSRVLNALFNRRYTLDLSYLKSMSRRDIERMLSGLSGGDPHDVALFMLRVYHLHRVPLSPDAVAWLRRRGLVPEDMPTAAVQALMARLVSRSSAEAFSALLKRHALSSDESDMPTGPAAAPAKRRAPRRDSKAKRPRRKPARRERRRPPRTRAATRPRGRVAKRARSSPRR